MREDFFRVGHFFQLACCAIALSACATTARDAKPAGGRASCPTLQLRFVIDKKYDARTLFGMLHQNDPAGLASRSAAMGLEKDFAQRIHDAPDYAGVSDEISRIVDARYAEVAPKLEAARAEYEKLWAPLVEGFSGVVTATTQHCWFHPTPETLYTDVVSAFHPGISDWYGNTVATKYDLPAESKRRILAHEIVLSQIFHAIRKYHPKSEISDWRVWALSEISTVWILNDSRLHAYWPDSPTQGYFAHSNYPQLAVLEEELQPVFSRRTSFRAYMDEAVARVGKIEEARLTTRK